MTVGRSGVTCAGAGICWRHSGNGWLYNDTRSQMRDHNIVFEIACVSLACVSRPNAASVQHIVLELSDISRRRPGTKVTSITDV
jgi:hypothetical protein